MGKIWIILILIALWVFLIWKLVPKVYGYDNQFFLTAHNSVLNSNELIKFLEKEKIRNIIISKAKQNSIPVDLFLRIAECESELNPKAKNPASTASGIFQFLKSTWDKTIAELGRELNIFNPIHNVEAAAYLFKKEGTNPWLASQDCWKNGL